MRGARAKLLTVLKGIEPTNNDTFNSYFNAQNKHLEGIFEDTRTSPRAPFSCENVNNKKESLGNSLV